MSPGPGWSLAIDFGTSNTAAAYRLGADRPLPVRLSDQAEQMPSAVVVTAEGVVKVGVEAVGWARFDPASFEASPKRRFGEQVIQLGETDHDLVGLVAQVFAHVGRRAQRFAGGTPPTTVVLTHPQNWEHRRDVLVQAAVAAGFPVDGVRLVSEPVAAATCYAVGRPVVAGEMVAVFDFGGGTCDVAVLRSTGDPSQPFVVLASDGVDPLGGEDFDVKLMAWVLEQLAASGRNDMLASLAGAAGLGSRLALREQVRAAKHALSDFESAHIPVVVGDAQTVLTITVGEFDVLIGPQIERAMQLLTATLRAAGTEPSQLATLYLTGGSSHLRAVTRGVTDILGKPPATLADPKLVVALGALDTHHTTAPNRNDPPPDPPPDPPTGGTPTHTRDPQTLGSIQVTHSYSATLSVNTVTLVENLKGGTPAPYAGLTGARAAILLDGEGWSARLTADWIGPHIAADPDLVTRQLADGLGSEPMEVSDLGVLPVLGREGRLYAGRVTGGIRRALVAEQSRCDADGWLYTILSVDELPSNRFDDVVRASAGQPAPMIRKGVVAARAALLAPPAMLQELVQVLIGDRNSGENLLLLTVQRDPSFDDIPSAEAVGAAAVGVMTEQRRRTVNLPIGECAGVSGLTPWQGYSVPVLSLSLATKVNGRHLSIDVNRFHQKSRFQRMPDPWEYCIPFVAAVTVETLRAGRGWWHW